ncbi:LOW QUALITY PROTEIN: hypothetical protein PanWU01x14_310670 [Parasponia andersonii]|uniref:Uncharacterized protein n=1 Tax=Parasponia andersonii TaxID=3476 RepID=A0A2P5AQ48_PARAD|nr:LOW QUALITY PROTEIN: hypothetical protein PanWU01x14_310670 [Parasponia andersonii]
MENRWNLLLNEILSWKEILSLESFRIGVKKIVDDRKWLNTMTSIKGFVFTVIYDYLQILFSSIRLNAMRFIQ